MTRLSDEIKKPCLKATLNRIKNIINNQTFLGQDPEKGEPVTPCIGGYKEKIHSDGSLNRIKLIIVVRFDLKNKKLVGYTWSPAAYMRTLK